MSGHKAEEIKALRAHALNPIQFLVVPRYLATVMMLTGLAIIADVVGVIGGLGTTLSKPLASSFRIGRLLASKSGCARRHLRPIRISTALRIPAR